MNQPETRALPKTSEAVHTVGNLQVFRHRQSGALGVDDRVVPVVACYDVPMPDGTNDWDWAVALGPETRGLLRSVTLQRFVLTQPGDRRYRWVYETDWTAPGQEARRRCRLLVGEMSESLEIALARVLGDGAIGYRVQNGEDVTVRAVERIDTVGRFSPVPQRELDLVLTAYVTAWRWC